MTIFELKEKEFIELNKMLKSLGMVSTGGEAKIRIKDGEANVNGETEWQVRKKLRTGDVIIFDGNEIQIK